ncbi:MAG TPA: YfjP family GTPase, partial [Actinomycetota bacterium]|nr:YfjP family GTPase [Actinomycetota bacterium]
MGPRRDSGSLEARLAALEEATDLADGRLAPADVAGARAVVERAGHRLGFGLEPTVTALAGATGSGKSSLFNALAQRHLAAVGVRRPTTGRAQACVWGGAASEALLDWVGAQDRHRLGGDPRLDGLVLLDLPDHDSTDESHRIEVDRLVELVDLLVWVVDPQKYADAALHERYLKPLATHARVMLVVLNHADELDADGLDACLVDLRRLLDSHGLEDVRILATSALTGDGVDALRAELAARVAARRTSIERLEADAARVTTALAA